MRIKIYRFFIIILTALFLTGCWDAYEITNYTLISLVGVDIKDDKIRFLLEYKPSNVQTTGTQGVDRKTSDIFISEGNSFTEAREAYLRRNANDVFLGSVRAVVFSDRFARKGIEEYINRIRGLREYSKTVELFTTTTKLEELFNSKELKTQNVGFDIEHLSKNLIKRGIISKRSVSIVMEEMQVRNTGYLINNLDIVKKKIEMTGYSVFNNNRKIGFIRSDQAKGISYLILKAPKREYTIDFDGVTAALSVKLNNKKIVAYYDDNGITFTIKIALDCEIVNLSKKIRIDSEKMKELEKKVSDTVKQEILNAIETSQNEYGCDYLGFYKAFRAKYNSVFKNMNWNEKYKQAGFNIEVNAKVTPVNLVNID